MNDKIVFLIQQIQSNAKNLATTWAILSFVAVPMLLMLVFKVKKDLTTFVVLFSLLYWIIIFIVFLFITKKHFEKPKQESI